ncbi:hypothetical protein CCH79_00019346 [Gambusia affinis]|uniref:Uncharacterized protein n=1 Tax=Gambusia affinis TaxID=33528 RepID=A0A315UWP6_GAMAF|nr:hypothetical protein CCH79_00019346 [Gambusia affinis]
MTVSKGPGITIPVSQSSGTSPDVCEILQSRLTQHNPTTARAIKNTTRILSTAGALPLRCRTLQCSAHRPTTSRVHMQGGPKEGRHYAGKSFYRHSL